MPTNSTHHGPDTGGVSVRQRVSISRWVNEPYPAWDCILTAHDVARLIRRPRWMLGSLAAIGQIPCRQRFHGKHIGWLKADILEWMVRSTRPPVDKTSNRAHCARYRHSHPNQHVLPLRPALGGQGSTSFIPGVSP
jgi:hypothetical protein